jgi:hypothetical protein
MERNMYSTGPSKRVVLGRSLIAVAGALAIGCTGGSQPPLGGSGPCTPGVGHWPGTRPPVTENRVDCAIQRAQSDQRKRLPIEELQHLDRLRRAGVLTRDEHRVAWQRTLDRI